MGFSLSSILKQGEAQINPFDHGQTAATVKQAQAKQAVAQLPSPGQSRQAPPQNFMQRATNDFANVSHIATNLSPIAHFVVPRIEHIAPTIPKHIQSAINTHVPTPLRGVSSFANNTLVKPLATEVTHASQIMQGKNPYQGTNKQIAGQIGTDALNVASIIPAGRAAKGIATADKTLPTAVRAFKAAKMAAVPGAGYGAGFGLTQSLENNDNLKHTAINTGVGAIAGGTLGAATGAATPLVGAAARKASKEVAASTPIQVAKNLGLKPPTKLSDEELNASRKVLAAQSGNGSPMDLTANDAAHFHNAQLKLGVKPGTPDGVMAVDKALAAHRVFDENVQQRVQAIREAKDKAVQFSQDHPLGMTSGAVDEHGNKLGLNGEPINPTSIVSTGHEQLPQLPHEAQALQTAPHPGEVSNSPFVVQNRLTKGANQGRQNISPETQALVSGEHTVRNTNNLATISAKNVDSMPTNEAIDQAHNLLAVPLGHVGDEETGFIAKTIEKADTEATKARQSGNIVEADRLSREAAALHDGLSEHATARGQATQALTMLYNRSPQGLYHSAIRDLGKAGTKVTPELQTKLQALADAIKTAPNKNAKTDALATFHQAVSKAMPQNISDKAIGIWKAGLLSGVKTQQGNAISNATFGVMKKVSDVPAAAVDKLMSVFTGNRTKTLSGRGIGSGAIEGTRNAAYTMKTGIDRRGAGDKYEQHAEIDFKNPVLNKTLGTAVRTVFRGMNAADQPFWYSAFKNSMYDQAKAAGRNKGLRGSELTEFMHETVKNPSDAMSNTALREANKSTLNYDTLGSKAVQGMHTAIDNFPGATTQGKAVAHGVINILAPFVRVPTAFLSRTVDFTPLGVGKELFHQVASGKFDQRALSQAVGEGLTGTGAIALGVALTQHNMLSGDYPKNDPKEAQRWKAEGITPNSVKLGGKWVSLNYLGPLGLLFNTGNKLESSKDQGAFNQAGQAIAGFGQGLMGQSFLQGFSGFSNAVNDPQRNLQSFVNSQAGSVVPSIVNDGANATDKFQRQANNPIQSIQGRIPVVRNNTLQPKRDVYGNPLKQPSGPLGTLIGVRPSNSLTSSNPVISEVNRLHNVDPNNTDLQVTPTPVNKSISVEGKKVNLSSKQRYDLQKQVGHATQDAWNKLIKTPEYKALDDAGKANALNNLRTDTTTLATRQYVLDNNLGTYAKAPSKAVQNLSDSTIADYAKAKSSGKSGGSTTPIAKNIDKSSKDILTKYNAMTAAQRDQATRTQPDFEYNHLKAQYNNDKANGKLNSATKDIAAQKTLAKAAVGKDYSHEVRDLHNLSVSDLYTYLSTPEKGKDKQKIAADILAYDNALTDAGLQTKGKFHDKNGKVTLVAKNSSGTYGKKASSGGKGPSIASIASSVAKYSGANSPLKYQKSLRDIAMRASMGKSSTHGKSSSGKAKLKGYTVTKGTTSLKAKKAFA